MQLGKEILGAIHVLPSVVQTLDQVQVEATFPDGTKLVTIHRPISRDVVDLKWALYGSFLPVPDQGIFLRLVDPIANAAPAPGKNHVEPEISVIRLTLGYILITHSSPSPIKILF